jgi:hypothetical protein
MRSRLLLVIALVMLAAAPAPASETSPGACALHLPHGSSAHPRASCGMTRLGGVEVSTTAGAGQLEIRDGIAAVVQRDDGMVALLDVRDPAAPKVLGRYNPNTGQPQVDQPYDGDVVFSSDGRYLFYARQTHQWSAEGLHVIDIRDPANPTQAAYAPAGGTLRVAYHRTADAEYVLILDATTGMQIFRFVRAGDAAAALVPLHVDALPQLKVGGPASAGFHIDPKDPILNVPLLYVTTGKTGIDVFDFSAPESPRKLGSWATSGLADFAVAATPTGRTIYAATEYWFTSQTKPRVVELDATNLGAITERRRFSPGPNAITAPLGSKLWQVQGLTLVGDLLYVAHSHAGLAVMETCCVGTGLRASTTDLGDANTGGEFKASAPYAMDVEVVGDVVFVTDAATGMLATFRVDPVMAPAP